MRLHLFISTILYLIASTFNLSTAQYSITCEYENLGNFDNLSLEYLPTLEGHSSTIMSNIINKADLDAAGTVEISSSYLPPHKMMYRLALQEAGEGVGISTGFIKNYIHIVMDKTTTLEVSGCEPFLEGMNNCSVRGNPESEILQELYDEILPVIYQERIEAYKIKTETKEEFVKQKHLEVFQEFADTCQYLIPVILSLHLILNDDIEKAVKEDPVYFKQFLDKVKKLDKHHPYTLEITDIITNLNPQLKEQKKEPSSKLALLGLGLLCLLLLFQNVYLRRKLKKAKSQITTKTPLADAQSRIAKLSPKEKEVFELMQFNLSNKEIASKLFIETTTVKSHISKIYQKLQISSRKEISQLTDNQGRTT